MKQKIDEEYAVKFRLSPFCIDISSPFPSGDFDPSILPRPYNKDKIGTDIYW